MGPSRRLSPSLDEGYRFASPPPSPVQGKGTKQIQGCQMLPGSDRFIPCRLVSAHWVCVGMVRTSGANLVIPIFTLIISDC